MVSCTRDLSQINLVNAPRGVNGMAFFRNFRANHGSISVTHIRFVIEQCATFRMDAGNVDSDILKMRNYTFILTHTG